MQRSIPFSHRLVFWDVLLTLVFITLVLSGIAGAFFGITVLQRGAGALCLIGALCMLYGVFIEPRRIVTRTFRMPLRNHTGLRIVIASDFHVGPIKGSRFVQAIVDRMNALKPDLMLLPGDFLYNELSDVRDLGPLETLRAPLGIFAVVGNHDSGNYLDLHHRHFCAEDRSHDVTAFLREHGIHVLRNERVLLTQNGEPLCIAGIDDLWPKIPQGAHELLASLDPDIPTILLSHHPDIIRLNEATVADIIVSAHTHGGQIRLPLIGPILPIPSGLGRWYDQGIFPVGERTKLFITHGVGETLMRARFCTTPEVVILETV